MNDKKYFIYVGLDKPNNYKTPQIVEYYHGGYNALSIAEAELKDIREQLKVKIRQAEKVCDCVRLFCYILGDDNEGKFVTLNQINYQTREYCANRGVEYEPISYK